MATREVEATSKFNSAFGAPSDRAVNKLKGHLTPWVQEFVRNAPFAVMATTDGDGNCDASPKGGKPGFVRVLDETHLLFPDVAGNRLFQSYQNVEANPHVGLIFFIPGVNDTVRVNGKASIVTKDELDRQSVELSLYELDDNSKHLQGMLIEVDEALQPLSPRAEVLQALGPSRDSQEPGRLPHPQPDRRELLQASRRGLAVPPWGVFRVQLEIGNPLNQFTETVEALVRHWRYLLDGAIISALRSGDRTHRNNYI